ncbi:hypothetical protein M422DRAFT_66743 [Sphaerobolus stellatus SS14]|nr:hypothetical protein M422DRAFT_66743 [Sphaerobolus stellatus SS14]
MSFFRKRQPSTTAATVVTVAQSPSQALAQTREAQLQLQQQQQQIQLQQQQQRQQQLQQQQASGSSSIARPAQNPTPQGYNATPSGSNAPTPQPRPTLPWSARRLIFPAPLTLSGDPPNIPSPSPFPRYGHSIPLTATMNGELYLFGGLVHESVRADMYLVSTRDLTATLLETIGDTPPPRVGHSSALVSTVVIVWGGDTKGDGNIDEPHDDALYLFNTGTREWTKVSTAGRTPVGRYGHAATMVGTRFFVFGGQVGGEFLNDLWAFDLNTLKVAEPMWEEYLPADGVVPPPRTGHICVTYNDRIYIFGGTDGRFHYNDTWVFDVATRTWRELTCIGFIPVSREGHSAAMVDDVIYVFGGRGMDGKDLGDLAALKLSNQRWYTFQNMGHSPSGRSGHAMASSGTRVFVLGGEGFTPTKPEENNVIHVLDTKYIRYPDPSKASQGTTANSTDPRRAQQQQQQQSGQPPRNVTPLQEPDRAISPPGSRSKGPNGSQMQGFPVPAAAGPIRPRRADEGLEDSTRQPGPRTDSPLLQRAERTASPDPGRAKSPGGGSAPASRAISPTQQGSIVQAPNMAAVAAAAMPRGVLSARSPSPNVDRSQPPPDAFYNHGGKSPTVQNGFVNGHHRPGSTRPGSGGSVVMDMLKQKEVELETAKRRETWMRAALTKATKAGFVWDTDLALNESDQDPGFIDEISEEPQKLADLVLALKRDRARIQNIVVEQARMASERFAEADRVRDGALQEAAFYRAKLASYESGSVGDVSRMDRERAAQFEKQLSGLASLKASQDRKITELEESLQLQMQLREQAEARVVDAAKRAEMLEESHNRISREHNDLRSRHSETEASLRDHAEKLISFNSLAQQKDADHRHLQQQIENLTSSRDQHLKALEQAQAALQASSDRSDELHDQLRRATEQVSRLEQDIAELRNEVETRTADAEAALAKLTDAENAWAASRAEADALRSLTTSGLGQLLDGHRDLKADEERLLRSHEEKVEAMDNEAALLREMLKESNQRIQQSEQALNNSRDQFQSLQSEQLSLRSQLVGLRAQMANVMTDSGRLRKELASRDAELRDKSRALAEVEVRLSTLRNYLAENGLLIDEEEISNLAGETPARLYELEQKLAEQTRMHDDVVRQLDTVIQQKQEAEARVAALSSRIDQGQTGSSGSSELVARAEEAENKLAEAEDNHKNRMAQMEEDYKTAVHYVKFRHTEKMLRRMKDELSKAKTVNQDLQGELTVLRGGSPSGSRKNVNGRGTPGSDDGTDVLRSQLKDLQGQNRTLTQTNSELRQRLDNSQEDVDRIRESWRKAREEAEDRFLSLQDLEAEVERLRASLTAARGGQRESYLEQLSSENASLKRDNEELSHKIELLLAVDHGDFGRNRPLSSVSENRVSRSSDDNEAELASLSQELEMWQRRMAGTDSLNRRPSDYDYNNADHQRTQSRS